jgi:uncharacterized RDD family membrane protein YckC
MVLEADAVEQQHPVDGSEKAGQPLAGTWPRYWARMFDITLLSLIVGGGLVYAVSAIYGPAILDSRSFTIVSTIILFPIVFGVDALIQFTFGNTPGKRLAGIRVETAAGQRPTLYQCLMRNLWVWVRGIGLGIPLLNIAAMIACYMKVRNGGLTSWDAEWNTRVFNKHSNVYRTLLTFCCFVALAGAVAWLERLGEKSAPSGQEVAQALAATNATLPLQIDEYTRLDKVDLSGGTVTYRYTMIGPNGAPVSPLVARVTRSENFQARLLKEYCAPGTYVAQKALGYKTRFLYHRSDGVPVSEHVLSAASCR